MIVPWLQFKAIVVFCNKSMSDLMLMSDVNIENLLTLDFT